jgi:SAM-dependent methyltransferase
VESAPQPSPYGQAFYEYQQAGSSASASEIVPWVTRLVRPTSVVDVGCGTGSWIAAFQSEGVTDSLGVDGDWVLESELRIPRDRFVPVDLTRTFALPRSFDLAISLEVAEHLPEQSARGFVESIVATAPAVLFSAAVPHQGGWNHLNEQWPEYWASLFKSHHYLPLDCLRPVFWNNPRTRWWYAQNMVLYLRADHPLWSTHEPSADVPALVHPQNYLARVEALRDATRDRTLTETVRRMALDAARVPGKTLRAVLRRSAAV